MKYMKQTECTTSMGVISVGFFPDTPFFNRVLIIESEKVCHLLNQYYKHHVSLAISYFLMILYLLLYREAWLIQLYYK
jgi:hypothetical protein